MTTKAAKKTTKKATASKAAKLSVAEIFKTIGVKQVVPPTKMLKRHIIYPNAEFTSEKTRLLIAIVHTDYGEHVKEVTDDYTLRCVKCGPYAASFFELSEKQVQDATRLREQ